MSFELGEEGFARMLHQRNDLEWNVHQALHTMLGSQSTYMFKYFRQQTDELDLFVRAAFDVQIWLERDRMFHQQLRSYLCEGVERRHAADEPRAVRLLQIHYRVHQAVDDLLARADERQRNFLLAFRLIVDFALFRFEDLQQWKQIERESN